MIICISYLCCVYIVLRIHYCNLWWYVRKEYGKYTVLRGISNNPEIMANIMAGGVFGDGYKGSMEETTTYGVSWGYSWKGWGF